MGTFLCERCGAEFQGEGEYRQHKVDHSLGKIKDVSINPVTGEEDVEPEVAPEGKAAKPTVPPVLAKEEVIRPIKLKYLYEGRCPECLTPVETIELDVANHHVAIAYCPNCKQQRAQREVVSLMEEYADIQDEQGIQDREHKGGQSDAGEGGEALTGNKSQSEKRKIDGNTARQKKSN